MLRYAVTDTLTLRLPFGELIIQAWTLLKVTALPAVLMAIPFGAMVAVQLSGLVNGSVPTPWSALPPASRSFVRAHR